MDFFQDSDKPYVNCKMLSLQISIQIKKQIEYIVVSARSNLKLNT